MMVKSNRQLFLKHKNKLKALQKKMPKQVLFTQVNEDGGFFNMFDHEATGRELNRFSKEVKDAFIQQNQYLTHFYNSFHEVYEVIDALDVEYLKSISIALKANEATVTELQETQKDINQLVHSHQKVVGGLTQFKKRLDAVKHLYDIDIMFEQYTALHSGLVKQQADILNLKSVIDQHQAHLGEISDKFKKVYDNLNITVETMKGELQLVQSTLQAQDMQQMALIVELKKSAKTAKGLAIVSMLVALVALVVVFTQ